MTTKRCTLVGMGLVAGLALCATAHAATAQQPNVLFICVDDLRPELNCFGASYIHSPNIDRLAEQGRAFSRHYVTAPSCGPSRCSLLTGRYGAPGNNALFQRAANVSKNPAAVPPSMPEWFRTHGYTTVSVGKVSHDPGGRGGRDWDDVTKDEIPHAWDRHLMPCGEWKHPRGAMHGLANGEIRPNGAQVMDVYQSAEGDDAIYPDGLIAQEGLQQLEELAAADKPFFLAMGLIKPHLPFGAPKKYLDLYEGVGIPPAAHALKPAGKTTWHGSGEFMKYNRWGKDPRKDLDFANEVRRHYAACVSYADKHVGDILATLKKSGVEDNSIVVLWGDHGWHLGEHAIWGKHSLFEEALHSPLIIRALGMKQPGIAADGVVSTLDIFPTLCGLTGVETPDFAQGHSLVPMLNDPQAAGHISISYKASATTLRTADYRLIQHNNGNIELYDHITDGEETDNIAADHPAVVAELQAQLAIENARR